MFLCHSLQITDSIYKIIRLNLVNNVFEILEGVYSIKEDCEEEVKNMNDESGPVEYEY